MQQYLPLLQIMSCRTINTLLVLEYLGAKLEMVHLEERTHHDSLTALQGLRRISNYLKEKLPEQIKCLSQETPKDWWICNNFLSRAGSQID
jgi:hypothetical protein